MLDDQTLHVSVDIRRLLRYPLAIRPCIYFAIRLPDPHFPT